MMILARLHLALQQTLWHGGWTLLAFQVCTHCSLNLATTFPICQVSSYSAEGLGLQCGKHCSADVQGPVRIPLVPSCTALHQLDLWTFPSSMGTSLSGTGAYRRWTFRFDAPHGLDPVSLQPSDVNSNQSIQSPMACFCGQQVSALHAHHMCALNLFTEMATSWRGLVLAGSDQRAPSLLRTALQVFTRLVENRQ